MLVESRRGSHLLSTKDETLLCWWDAFLLLDSLLDALDLVRLLNVELDLYSHEPSSADRCPQVQRVSIAVELQ